MRVNVVLRSLAVGSLVLFAAAVAVVLPSLVTRGLPPAFERLVVPPVVAQSELHSGVREPEPRAVPRRARSEAPSPTRAPRVESTPPTGTRAAARRRPAAGPAAASAPWPAKRRQAPPAPAPPAQPQPEPQPAALVASAERELLVAEPHAKLKAKPPKQTRPPRGKPVADDSPQKPKKDKGEEQTEPQAAGHSREPAHGKEGDDGRDGAKDEREKAKKEHGPSSHDPGGKHKD